MGKSFLNALKIFAVGAGGLAVNTLLPVAATVPSKYTPFITGGIMAGLYALNPPKKEDDANAALTSAIGALQAQVQQLQADMMSRIVKQ